MGAPYLLCGRIASGKSTLAKALFADRGAVLVTEDILMATLYPDEIRTLEDCRDDSSEGRRAPHPLHRLGPR